MKKILTIAALTLLTLGGCNKNNEKEENIETPPLAVSTQTWTFGDQTWSDAIRIPACDKSDFISSITAPDCRSYTYRSNTWYYYNWSYVITNQEQLCPAPWHVPFRWELEILEKNTTSEKLMTAWGLPGYAFGSSMVNVGEDGYMWSPTSGEVSSAACINYTSGKLQVVRPPKSYGFQVRCVR
jgi:hypothetical protein